MAKRAKCSNTPHYYQVHKVRVIGSLSNDDGGGNENGTKVIGLDWQNNNFARFFVHFFVVAARLQHESTNIHVLSRT